MDLTPVAVTGDAGAAGHWPGSMRVHRFFSDVGRFDAVRTSGNPSRRRRTWKSRARTVAVVVERFVR